MLNDYMLSVLLGIVEGLTEFLPVSSTAHLRLAQLLAENYHLTNIDMNDPYWKMYTIVIQLGAILCLPVYFAPRILKFIGTFPGGERGDRNIITHPLSLAMIAFVVTAIPSFLLSKTIGKHLESFTVMGAALLIGGIVMWVVDAMFGRPPATVREVDTQVTASPPENPTTPARHYRTEHMEEMTLIQAVWIGACQILSAVFPGSSRSMCTIAGGQLAGMSRASALEFSFFVSIPTMFVATSYTLVKALHPSKGKEADAFSPKGMTSHDWIVLGIGFLVSFIVALGVVAWFMAWVRRRGFTAFAIYRIIVGSAVLFWAIKTHAG